MRWAVCFMLCIVVSLSVSQLSAALLRWLGKGLFVQKRESSLLSSWFRGEERRGGIWRSNLGHGTAHTVIFTGFPSLFCLFLSLCPFLYALPDPWLIFFCYVPPSVSDLPSPSVHHFSFSPALTPRHATSSHRNANCKLWSLNELTAACVLTVCMAYIGTMVIGWAANQAQHSGFFILVLVLWLFSNMKELKASGNC